MTTADRATPQGVPSAAAPEPVRTRPAGWAATLSCDSALIGLLAFCLLLAPAVRVVQLNPDVVEYVDVARRLLNGEGFRLGVKAYHFGGTDVLHHGLAERPPLFPWMVAAILGLGLDLRAVQMVNAALAGLSVGLVAALGRALFGRAVGIGAGLLAAISPVVLARLVLPMSEAVTIALLLGATLLVVRASEPARRGPYLAAGLLLGLGYLARPTTAALVAAMLPAVLLAARDRRAALAGVGWLVAGVLVFAVPISLYSLVTQDTLSYSGQSYLYAVHKDSDVLRNGYGRELPTPAAFISENLDFVLTAIQENVRDYALLLFWDREWLRPLWPAWVGVGLAAAFRAFPRRALIPAALALGSFLMYALTWANFQERYQLPSMLLLLPFAAYGLVTIGRVMLGRLPRARWLQHVPLALAVAVAGWWWLPTWREQYRDQFRYGDESIKPRVDDGLRWTGPPRWSEDAELARVNEWLRTNTAPTDPVTHGQPWPYTFFTGRPSTLLPTKLSAERLRQFVTDYRIAFVLLDQRDRDRRDYRTDLDAWAAEGVAVQTLGSFRIYDTRALWRT
ncbi:MAG: glycosyltransferase family 39 protein [Chloroflexi bacterium]|nr:glycosyltransferase family 39 protein [Chloroflexota bacterium]